MNFFRENTFPPRGKGWAPEFDTPDLDLPLDMKAITDTPLAVPNTLNTAAQIT